MLQDRTSLVCCLVKSRRRTEVGFGVSGGTGLARDVLTLGNSPFSTFYIRKTRGWNCSAPKKYKTGSQQQWGLLFLAAKWG